MPATDPTLAAGDAAARANVLQWQSSYRAGTAVVIMGAALLLRAMGVVSAHSVGVHWLGTRMASQAFAAATFLYIAIVGAVHWHVRRRRAASAEITEVLLASDVVVVFACALLLTPPGEFDRALLISVFLVQFTQLYFGWRKTVFQLAVIAASYTSIVTLAFRSDMLVSPSEQLWTFTLFTGGALAYAWLLGHQGMRARRLTRLFDRAREGDFGERYVEGHDKFPDHITAIGRSYNDLRGHLETIVLTDPLSGCFNRRGFDQLAGREVSRGIRAKWDMSMLALDVDHFKEINDEFGHLTGDEAIKEIGALIREVARAGDVVARTGGEEFSILAPETDEQGAMHLAGRILQAFRDRHFASLRGRMPLRISIGVASQAAETDEIVRKLTARADEALYVAKHNGRDQAVLWQTGMRAFDPAKRTTREIERLH